MEEKPNLENAVSTNEEEQGNIDSHMQKGNAAEAEIYRKPSSRKKILSGVLFFLVISVIIIVIVVSSGQKPEGRYSSANNYSEDYNYDTPKTGVAGAVAKAKMYLSITALSYQGLIDQLKYEGFSDFEAKYAANNCGADWSQQAVKKAKSYMEMTSLSYYELISQLEYEGFTSVQAKYGADHCGYFD